jgi:hypothetical protein
MRFIHVQLKSERYLKPRRPNLMRIVAERAMQPPGDRTHAEQPLFSFRERDMLVALLSALLRSGQRDAVHGVAAAVEVRTREPLLVLWLLT